MKKVKLGQYQQPMSAFDVGLRLFLVVGGIFTTLIAVHSLDAARESGDLVTCIIVGLSGLAIAVCGAVLMKDYA